MNIFPHTPTVSKAHRSLLAPHVANAKACRKWLKTDPPVEDIKRAVLMEIQSGRDTVSRGVAGMLLVRLQKLERREIWMNIAKETGGAA